MLKKQEAIISDIKITASWLIEKNIKFGIRVPQTVTEALRLEKNNGNHMWRDVITKDINAVMIELKLLDEGEDPFYLSGDQM